MRIVLLYIILLIIIIYADSIFGLKGHLIISAFIVSLFYFKSLKNLFKRKKNNLILFFYSIIVVLLFYVLYNLISQIIFDNSHEYIHILELSLFDYMKIILIYPLLEELVFRNGILRLLMKKYRAVKANLITSMGFALCHLFTDTGLIYAFLFSFFIGLIYIKSENVWWTFILHLLNNIMVIIALPLIIKILMSMKEYYIILGVIIILIILIYSLQQIMNIKNIKK